MSNRKAWALVSVVLAEAPLHSMAADCAELRKNSCPMPASIQIDGLEPVEYDGLVCEALKPPGGGSLCAAQTFVVTKPVFIYRLHGESGEKPVLLNWWSLTKPSGSARQYRKDKAMCSGFEVVKMTQCQLVLGTQVAVGYGQSYTCSPGETAGVSENLQLYMSSAKKGLERQTVGCVALTGLAEP